MRPASGSGRAGRRLVRRRGLGVSVALLRRVLSHFLGFEWTMSILVALVVGCFGWVIVGQRRKRRAWEATRHRPSDQP